MAASPNESLLALSPGTVVAFLDEAGPLCALHASGAGDRAVWALRPAASMPAERAPAPLPGVTVPGLSADALFVATRCGDALVFRSLGAEGRSLQACNRTGTLALRNHNTGAWERWRLCDNGLVNERWGTPLGLGLAIVSAALAADAREAARRSARDVRRAESLATAAEAAARHAGETARAEAGRGWAALERRLEAAEESRTRAKEEATAQRRAAESAEARAVVAERAVKSLRRTLAALETRADAAEEEAAAAAEERDRLGCILAEAVQAAQIAQAQALSVAALAAADAARAAEAAAPAEGACAAEAPAAEPPGVSAAPSRDRYDPSPSALSEDEAEPTPRRLFSEAAVSSVRPPCAAAPLPPRWAESPAMQPLRAMPRAVDPPRGGAPVCSPPESGASSGKPPCDAPASKPESWSVARAPPARPPVDENAVAPAATKTTSPAARRVQEPRFAAPREPLGTLAAAPGADLWMGLWQPLTGGETPAARGGPRRAAGMAAPRVHSWRVEEGSETSGL